MRSTAILLVLLFFFAASVNAQIGEELGFEEDPADYTEFEDPFEERGVEIGISDPLQPVNRATFWVNDKLYFYLLKPVARAYRVTPEPVRESVDNFFGNLATPARFANNLLQFKFAAAGNELRRFLLNSTVGLAGFFDPAEGLGWHMRNEDLGQTLGLYGVGSGIYLVLPLLGSTNVRDGIGRIGDGFLDPVPYVIPGLGEYIAVKAYEQVNAVSLDDDTYEKIKEDALDTYLFVRNAYTQRREALIKK
ncbi:MAG: VacJ family lipoprotein [Desulfuromonadales bacterium]|jgi:phospholipid-binding lipoprotein MlaA